MKAVIVIPLVLLLLAATGSFLLSGRSSAKPSTKSLLRGVSKEERALQDGWFDEYENEEVRKESLRTHYQEQVQYHENMRPCLHKSYYAMVGFFNPWLKEEIDEEEDNNNPWLKEGTDEEEDMNK